MSNELFDLAAKLRPYAMTAEPHQAHWIGGGDAGPSYCYGCAEKEVARLVSEWKARKRALALPYDPTDFPPEERFFVDGGWEDHQEDGCTFCETCGHLLGYTLTEYGAEDELNHFREFSLLDGEGQFSAVTAYELLCVAEHYFWSADIPPDVVRLCSEAVSLVPMDVKEAKAK